MGIYKLYLLIFNTFWLLKHLYQITSIRVSILKEFISKNIYLEQFDLYKVDEMNGNTINS